MGQFSQHTWLTNHTQPFQYSEYIQCLLQKLASTERESVDRSAA